MRYCLSLIIALLVNSVYGEEKTTLYDFRYWTAPDHTRIVIDTEEDTLFSISKNNDYIVISVDDAEVLSDTFSNIFFKDERIQKIRIKRDRETIKLIFHINKDYRVKHFTLAPNTKYKHHRLVVDIIDLEAKSTVKSTKPVKDQTLSNRKIILVDAGHGGEDSGAIGKNKSQILVQLVKINLKKKMLI